MRLHEIHTSHSYGGVAISCGCGWTAEAGTVGAASDMIEAHRREVSRQNAEARLRDTVDDPSKRVEL